MTELVCKPTTASVVKGRGLYEVYMNRVPLGLLVRAKNAGEADEMLRFVFEHELKGKTLDFRIGDFKEENDEKKTDDRSDSEEKGTAAESHEAAEGGRAADPAPPRE